jgi:hypothetical protein
MGITVAPLTATVMGAAPENKSGTASGINNAVARLAGVLAIAILGAVALTVFSTSLESRTDDIDLSSPHRRALQDQASELGNIEPPDDLPSEQRSAVDEAIRLAFVDTFRVIALITAGLAWISAFVSSVLIESARFRRDAIPT